MINLQQMTRQNTRIQQQAKVYECNSEYNSSWRCSDYLTTNDFRRRDQRETSSGRKLKTTSKSTFTYGSSQIVYTCTFVTNGE